MVCTRDMVSKNKVIDRHHGAHISFIFASLYTSTKTQPKKPRSNGQPNIATISTLLAPFILQTQTHSHLLPQARVERRSRALD